jgi:hypothetical protein
MDATTRTFSFWALLGCAGCAAIAVSWFLPWLALGDGERRDLGVGQGDIRALEDAARERGPEAEAVVALVRSLRAGEPATGREWLSLFAFAVDHASAREDLEPREERVFRASHLFLAALPWVAGALALLLLADRLRRLGAPAIAGLFTVGLVLGGLGGLVWLGASLHARERAAENVAHLGVGLKVLAAGGLACFLAALFGVSARTWWRGWGLGVLLSAALVAGTVLYIRG